MEETKIIKEPTIEELDNIRKEGFRPGVIASIVHEKKILMFFKKEYKLWMLPQGGINNKEMPVDALQRELIEEVGATFSSNLEYSKAKMFGNDRMEFKPGKHALRELHTDEGEEVQMIGKDYLFYMIPAKTDELNIKDTDFDEHFWMSFREAYFIADKIYQKGKRRITLKIMNALHSLELIE